MEINFCCKKRLSRIDYIQEGKGFKEKSFTHNQERWMCCYNHVNEFWILKRKVDQILQNNSNVFAFIAVVYASYLNATSLTGFSRAICTEETQKTMIGNEKYKETWKLYKYLIVMVSIVLLYFCDRFIVTRGLRHLFEQLLFLKQTLYLLSCTNLEPLKQNDLTSERGFDRILTWWNRIRVVLKVLKIRNTVIFNQYFLYNSTMYQIIQTRNNQKVTIKTFCTIRNRIVQICFYCVYLYLDDHQ